MESVRRIRKKHGWSQEKTAAEANINKVTLVHIETGRTSPNVETLQKLADAFGVELADFFPKAQAPLFPDDAQVLRISEPRDLSPEEQKLKLAVRQLVAWVNSLSEYLRGTATEDRLDTALVEGTAAQDELIHRAAGLDNDVLARHAREVVCTLHFWRTACKKVEAERSQRTIDYARSKRTAS